MKKLWYVLFALTFVFATSVTFIACDPADETDPENEKKKEDPLNQALGWLGLGGNGDDLSAIEDDVNFGTNGNNLPESVNLLNNFPTIGNQGQYGTCVAWAVAYNLRTYMYAKNQNLTTSQITNSNTFSPKDLFWAIDNSKKGADCNGTGFQPALDVLQSRGVATMATVPYTDLGNCSSSPISSWTTEAGNYKIDNYREITVNSAAIPEIKGYLANGRPVVIGAKLGDNFMNWNSTGVLNSETYGYSGQHAYHAMILGGYDNSKGSNGAFKVINSWGTNWGDAGYIWVDYNFFVAEFCFAAFVAKGQTEDPNNNNNPTTGEKDLVSWNLTDADNPDQTDPRYRKITYNAWNTGGDAIPASSDWCILYLYYNAYNANDYGVLIYDYYSDDYGSLGENGDMNGTGATLYGSSGNWWNNYNIPANSSVAQSCFGTENFVFYYKLKTASGNDIPDGQYYFVLISDGFDVVSESNEENNYFFYAKSDGSPWQITGGVLEAGAKDSGNGRISNLKPSSGAASPSQTLVSRAHPNTYSQQEIYSMIQHQRKSGDLLRKAQQFRAAKDKNIGKASN